MRLLASTVKSMLHGFKLRIKRGSASMGSNYSFKADGFAAA
jgi:hypothetical protein